MYFDEENQSIGSVGADALHRPEAEVYTLLCNCHRQLLDFDSLPPLVSMGSLGRPMAAPTFAFEIQYYLQKTGTAERRSLNDTFFTASGGHGPGSSRPYFPASWHRQY